MIHTGVQPCSSFCPNMACPARGQTGQGNIGIHSRKDRRFICTQCRKTFAATHGTVFYRLRTSADLVRLERDLARPWLPGARDRGRLWGRRAVGGGIGGTCWSAGPGCIWTSGRATARPRASAGRRDPREATRGHRLDGAGHDGQDTVVARGRGQRAPRHAVVLSCAAISVDAPQATWASLACAHTPH